ncbi:uncharacterized protein LOC114940052 isoform X2 [Nylanderia fulva]|uniref:uncharacterized protein LOC114940052 isoform X2 n=1 Tax=Nylanderia fulva TaxID=613905 RepID=UPI0010FB6A7D|nr:uncharacterized protein LOC114940052 isoform X2 [Nylanderia fulva]
MEQKDKKNEKTIEEIFTEALFKFSIKCLHKYEFYNSEDSFAFSPYNLYKGLFLAYLTSSGVIEKDLKEILFLTEVSEKCDLIDTVNFDKSFETEMTAEENASASAAECDYESKSMCFIEKSKLSEDPSQINKIFNGGFVNLDDDTNANINRINKEIQCQTENFHSPQKLGAFNRNMDIVLMTVLRLSKQKFLSIGYQSDASSAWTDPDKRMFKCSLHTKLNMLVGEFPYKNGNTSLFVLAPCFFDADDKWKVIRNHVGISNMINVLSTKEGMLELRKVLDHQTSLAAASDRLPTIIEVRRRQSGQFLRKRRTQGAFRQRRAPYSCQGHKRGHRRGRDDFDHRTKLLSELECSSRRAIQISVCLADL